MAYEGPELLIVSWAPDESHGCLWHEFVVCVEVENCCRALAREHTGFACCQEDPEFVDPF